MASWFLSTRAHSVGGPVAAEVKIIDKDRGIGFTGDLLPELQQAIQGHDVFFAVHGFNVNQSNGLEHLGIWLKNVDIGDAVKIGILWPGDCFIPIFVDYVVEGHEAIQSGKILADFLNKNFIGAVTLSFASHSLGARVVLQTIKGLNRDRVHRVLLMAGAIDDNCLTNEYASAAKKIDQISLLTSKCDAVLAAAYPLGNPIQGIIDRGHPYYHAALGREGPAHPDQLAPSLHAGWEIPKELNYGHLDYIPGRPLPDMYPQPCNIPPNTPVPPQGIPAAMVGDTRLWKPAFSAGFATNRYK
jgi:hypothetical protein